MSEKSPYRVTKLKPHDKEDDFDFRKSEHKEEDLTDMFVMYEYEDDIDPVLQEVINKFGFTYNGEFWETKTFISEEEIESLEHDGIVIEKI